MAENLSSNQKKSNTNPAGGGGEEMRDLIYSLDWSKTPVGAMETWPQSLKATIKIMLGSRYPMVLLWGEALIQIYNEAYIGLIGDKHPRALGHSIKETQAESWEAIGPMIHKVMSTGLPNWVPAQMLAVDRSGYPEETYFSLSYSAVENDAGAIEGMLCVCSEVTQQVLGERRLRLQRDLASKAGETRNMDTVCQDVATAISDYPWDIPFALLYLREADGTLTLRSTVAIEAYSPACIKYIDLQSNDPDPWSLKRAIKGETVFTKAVDKIVAVPGGPWNEPVQGTLALPIPSSGQKIPLGVLVAGISPNQALDESYSSFYGLLAGQISVALRNALAYEEERKRTEALAEIDRAKTTFFTNVSHEFRTPLTLILGPLEDVLGAPESASEAQRDRLEAAYRNALRLQKLVNSLLDFSRIEAGRAQASYKAVNLSEVTAELASMFRSVLEKAGLKLMVNCPPLPEPVYVDRDMWEKIVLNLLSNAFKHTFKGEIGVRLRWMNDHVELTIRDTGIGIPREQLPRLFERFHRVPNARSRTHEGSGIGLALVHELVKLLGGKITVNSVVDQGTTFLVSIPTGKAHLPADRIEAESKMVSTALGAQSFVQEALRWLPKETSAANESTDPSGSDEQVAWQGVTHSDKAQILLADDNGDMRDYVRRLLEPYCEVKAVPDGKAALEAARQNPPDLILSDVMMPRMDGFVLLRALRADDALRTIPVILLSARAGEESAVEGLEAGADDYLVKPFSAKELIARVNTHLTLSRLRTDVKAMEKLAEANKELKRVNTDLDNFIYTASHDLKAPIINIEGLVNLLNRSFDADNKNNQKVQALLGMIQQSIDRFKNTITDLAEVAKVQSEGEEEVSKISFKEMLEEVKLNVKSLIDESNAYIQEDFSQAPAISFSKKNLRSILYNLVSNAVKYRSADRPVKIFITSSRPNNTHILLSIQDNGVGIKEEDKPKVFMMFKRLNQHVEGTGVGMTIVKKIIDNNGGKIEIESEIGRGTLFKVYFRI